MVECSCKRLRKENNYTMNQILKELGYSKKDKVVLVHADDVGLNLSTIEAFAELTDLGTISTGSAMVPTSWFPEVVKQASENPAWDLGLHLAFNGEYQTYKWRPISTIDPASGFVDENGYFIEDKQVVQETADPAFLARELEAQINVAKSLGLEPTHVDTHTGTLWNKKFMQSYVDVYENHQILPVLPKPSKDSLLIEMIGDALDLEKLKALEEEGFPLVDDVAGLPVEHTYDIEERFELAKTIFKNMQPGNLTHFAFHPMKDTPEAQALGRYVGGRTGDFEVFRKKEMKTFFENEGIQLVGYREVAAAVKRLVKMV